MRQWMVDPRIMCRQHLLGEHVEHHMMIGTINRGISMQGFCDKNLIEPSSLYTRHDALVDEMHARGYNHKSPMKDILPQYVGKLPDCTIDSKSALADLINRCPECHARLKHMEESC